MTCKELGRAAAEWHESKFGPRVPVEWHKRMMLEHASALASSEGAIAEAAAIGACMLTLTIIGQRRGIDVLRAGEQALARYGSVFPEPGPARRLMDPNEYRANGIITEDIKRPDTEPDTHPQPPTETIITMRRLGKPDVIVDREPTTDGVWFCKRCDRTGLPDHCDRSPCPMDFKPYPPEEIRYQIAPDCFHKIEQEHRDRMWRITAVFVFFLAVVYIAALITGNLTFPLR